MMQRDVVLHSRIHYVLNETEGAYTMRQAAMNVMKRII